MKDQNEMANELTKVLQEFQVVKKIQMMIVTKKVLKKVKKSKKKKMEICEEL